MGFPEAHQVLRLVVGKGGSQAARITVKIAVLAPMPSASVTRPAV